MGELAALTICVPTPLRKTKDPDLTYIVSAVSEIKKYLRPGQLVILESTTYPGTLRNVVALAGYVTDPQGRQIGRAHV